MMSHTSKPQQTPWRICFLCPGGYRFIAFAAIPNSCLHFLIIPETATSQAQNASKLCLSRSELVPPHSRRLSRARSLRRPAYRCVSRRRENVAVFGDRSESYDNSAEWVSEWVSEWDSRVVVVILHVILRNSPPQVQTVSLTRTFALNSTKACVTHIAQCFLRSSRSASNAIACLSLNATFHNKTHYHLTLLAISYLMNVKTTWPYSMPAEPTPLSSVLLFSN
jgi:hypothetical protein